MSRVLGAKESVSPDRALVAASSGLIFNRGKYTNTATFVSIPQFHELLENSVCSCGLTSMQLDRSIRCYIEHVLGHWTYEGLGYFSIFEREVRQDYQKKRSSWH